MSFGYVFTCKVWMECNFIPVMWASPTGGASRAHYEMSPGDAAYEGPLHRLYLAFLHAFSKETCTYIENLTNIISRSFQMLLLRTLGSIGIVFYASCYSIDTCWLQSIPDAHQRVFLTMLLAQIK